MNISAIQFQRDDFVSQVEEVLSAAAIDTALLELEVTESVVMRDVSVVVRRLRQLQDMGLCIAIDDFGTGYSSLQYLQQLPLDALKIDRSFIDRAEESKGGQALIETIISLAQHFNLRTVGEGIENQAQLDYLRRVGCNDAQGYFFARPMSAADIEQHCFLSDDSPVQFAA